MTSTRLSVFALGALVCVFSVALAGSDADATLKDLAGYRHWTRLTEKPVVVEDLSAFG
jgi:hypothetical protein